MIILTFFSAVNKMWNARKHREDYSDTVSWIDNMIDRKINGTL